MKRHEEYAARHAQLKAMMDSLTEGMPPGPIGFLNGNHRIVEERRQRMYAEMTWPRLIEFGMYNSYHRCRMN